MATSSKRPPFNPEIGLGAIDPVDVALVGGDRQLLTEFLEPYAAALHGQPARILKELADDLFAFYVADTLAYMARMLPPPRRSKLRNRVTRPSSPAELQAPDPEEMQRAPHEALVGWTQFYRPTGGMLMMEARAIFRHLSVPQVLKARSLPVPHTALASARFPEELPTGDYLQNLAVDLFPPNFYWDSRLLTMREEQFRAAFQQCLAGLGVRYLRIAQPRDGARLEEIAKSEGVEVADSMLRMQLPIDAYRRRRLEALAIFQDLVAPALARNAGN